MKSIVAILVCVLLAGTVNATLLVHEDFEDMTLGSGVSGTTGVGVASWFVNSGAAPQVAASASFGSYTTGSQALILDRTTTGTTPRAELTPVTGLAVTSGSLYMSFLFDFQTQYQNLTGAYMQWRATTSTEFRSAVLTTNNIGIGTSLKSSTLGEDNTDTLLGQGMYMIISKFAGLGTANGSSKIWAIDAAAFDGIAAGGITEAELDTVAYLLASSTEDATNIAWNDGEKLSFYVGTQAKVMIDEIKIGTTLADVTVVPEPATLTLLGAASLVTLLGRSKRRG